MFTTDVNVLRPVMEVLSYAWPSSAATKIQVSLAASLVTLALDSIGRAADRAARPEWGPEERPDR